MDEIDKDNQIDAGLSKEGLEVVKKQFEKLKKQLENNKNKEQLPSDIDSTISNLEKLIDDGNINTDQVNKSLAAIKESLVNSSKYIENIGDVEKQKTKLDNTDNIPKYNKLKPNDDKNTTTQLDQTQEAQVIKKKAEEIKYIYNKEVSQDVSDIGEKAPWLRRLIDRAS